jgi:PIN domain nuclease of toxin-antitoxin system
MSRLLLDTHLLLWAVSAPQKLSLATRSYGDCIELVSPRPRR